MVRRIAFVALALTLHPAGARAQDAVLTVTVPSADVHQGPSIAAPVVGRAPRSSVLPVSRNLGSWAKVAWPNTPEGFGYVHVTMGRLGASSANASAPNVSPRSTSTPLSATSAPPSAAPAVPPVARGTVRERMAILGGPGDSPVTHILGVGAMVGSRSSFGATARAWRTDRVGLQLGVAREAVTSDVAGGRLTSMRVDPGVVFGLFDHVSDYFWIRPYVGSVVSFRRQSLKVSAPGGVERSSDNGVGVRAFGGSELTFAGVPRFGLSAELGYGRFPAPFPGFEAGRLSVAIAGHWYIR